MTVVIRVRTRGQCVDYSGRSVDTIIRREYGRRATVWGGNVIGPKRHGGAYPVLGVIVSVDGTLVGQ